MRTWDDNKQSINQLWPTQWNDEESKLLHDDLSPLDQAMLYDAIRNTKRSHDTPFVHLKWFLDEYRSLSLSRQHASKAQKSHGVKLDLVIDDERDKMHVKDFLAYVDGASPSDFEQVENLVLDKLPEMYSLSAVRVLNYARARLLGQKTQFSRVARDGSTSAIPVGTGLLT